MKILDFRSDTVTLPTKEMLEAMTHAKLGDDVYGDDETINRLELLAAEKIGKEAALFVPSGTMGNLIAVMAHTTPGQEIILEESCHIYLYEVAGIARLAGVQARTIPGINGLPPLEAIKNAVRQENIHFPETGLISLESTHNMSGGMTLPLKEMASIYHFAKEKGIPVHLDGARLFNAAKHLQVEAKEITRYTDSVMFCLSKGLSAPVGSILAGTQDFIVKARKLRKMLGGGMRQAGVIAAAGIVALEGMVDRLAEDHVNALLLAKELNSIKGVSVDLEKVHSNIINVDFYETGFKAPGLASKMKDKGLLVNPRNDRVIRFVTHRGVGKEEVASAVEVVKEILKG
ncbi:low-specificity L-threonine aldolase [Alkaliphilus serpentinus]|uniref:Low-specificity L-threonine aldolase n=1 Tax=Alkaliphilus serpentinus TaxID=1482731 RepID=A0A833HMJ3_9FIRM|nr:low-specificity L-threonine aldolase [Alkaliphilus serpentinus]KAB3527643.1 low-specificity L-threonine aldolase [Alkaliphilus serpentinus]